MARKRANGDGSIYKLSGNRRNPWAIRITVGWDENGKQKYKYLSYHESYTDAKTALREYLVKPFDLSKKGVTIADVFNDWMESTTLASQTISGYKSAFNQSAFLHNMKMRDIKVIHLENAMYALKPSMQPNFKNAMKQLYKHAIKYEIVDKDLSFYIQPEKVERGERKPFTLEQIERIRAFDHKYNDIVIILLYTGMRINELLKMKKENVFLDDRYMIGGLKTKAGKNRIIPIHDDIFELVKERYNNSSTYLIENERAKVVYRTFMTVYWKKLKEYLNTDQTPHCTRHTFVSRADTCGINATSLKRIVGHSLADITAHYNHKDIQQLLHEINKLKY